ncbi:MAG: C40 family peptidase [Ferruginibacter sp.]
MNKFMGGLTLGIIATTCFFLIYRPFQKDIAVAAEITQNAIPESVDSIPVISKVDTNQQLPAIGLNKTNKADRDSLVTYAKLLLGTPYLYGSTDPAKGFDCSGFVTYVFNHFNISVPRSSFEFAGIGTKKSLSTCKPGDVILFTGTHPEETAIGHIGIIAEITNGYPLFIHSSSGKANGVTITSMDNKFYQERFIGVVDLLSM